MHNDVIRKNGFLESHKCCRDLAGPDNEYYACARFSTGKAAMAIVAKVVFSRQGKLKEWTAFMGGIPSDYDWKDASSYVAQHGEALLQRDAEYFFPLLERSSYRYN